MISQIWSKLPGGNDTSNTNADGLNTLGFSGAANLPIKENFGVLRVDHDLAKNWQVMGSYRYFEQDAAVDKQIDIAIQNIISKQLSAKEAMAQAQQNSLSELKRAGVKL